MQATENCQTQRARQSGAATKPQEHSIPFVIECGQTLKIANDDHVVYQTKSQFEKHGMLKRTFQSTDNSEFML